MLFIRPRKKKFHAVVDEVEEAYKKGQPVLVGTINIDTSELVSSMLNKRGIPHKVLNAKFHELEAEIVAQGWCTWCGYYRNQHGWSWY